MIRCSWHPCHFIFAAAPRPTLVVNVKMVIQHRLRCLSPVGWWTLSERPAHVLEVFANPPEIHCCHSLFSFAFASDSFHNSPVSIFAQWFRSFTNCGSGMSPRSKHFLSLQTFVGPFFSFSRSCLVVGTCGCWSLPYHFM